MNRRLSIGLLIALAVAAVCVVFSLPRMPQNQLSDAPVYKLTGLVSGHALKHLCAAVAGWQILQMFTSALGPRLRVRQTPVNQSTVPAVCAVPITDAGTRKEFRP